MDELINVCVSIQLYFSPVILHVNITCGLLCTAKKKGRFSMKKVNSVH